LLVERTWTFPFALFPLPTKFFDELVSFVYIDVRKEWAEKRALWGTNETILSCSSEIHVPRIEEFADQVQEPLIGYLLAQKTDECGMMDFVEA
jgi:hypothetical protein